MLWSNLLLRIEIGFDTLFSPGGPILLILDVFLSDSLTVVEMLDVPAGDLEKDDWDCPRPSEKEFLWRDRSGDEVWEPRVFLASFKGEEGPLLIMLWKNKIKRQ